MTFTRSWHALAAVRSLGQRGVEIVCGDEYLVTPGGLSRYASARFEYASPASDPEGFLDDLERAVIEHAPSDDRPYVLLPVQQETYLIAAHRERFEPHVSIALAKPDLIDRVRNKAWLAEFARSREIPVPETIVAKSERELREHIDRLDFPVVIKPPRGAGGSGVDVVDAPERLLECYRELRDGSTDDASAPMIQELVEGDDYCVTAIFDSGRAHAVVSYKNVAKISSGSPGAVRETVSLPEAESIAVRLLEELEWHGIAQVDFMWDGSSEPKLIEINPRLFGGLFQTIASGVDYPWMLFHLAQGLKMPEPETVDVGLRTETPVVGLLATLREYFEDATDGEVLKESWEDAVESLKSGNLKASFKTFVSGLQQSLSSENRERTLSDFLDDNRESVSQMMASDDPKAALGLIYPLAIFLRHGKIDAELFHGVMDSEAVDD